MKQFMDKLKAGYPLFWTDTFEPRRLFAAVKVLFPNTVLWNAASEPKDVRQVLRTIVEGNEQRKVLFLQDFHYYLGNPEILALLQDTASLNSNRNAIIVHSLRTLPQELQHIATYLDLPLPTVDEILQAWERRFPANKKKQFQNVLQEAVVNALGLTLEEVENAFAFAALVAEKESDFVDIVRRVKKDILKQTELVDWSEPVPLSDIGGLDLLKEYILARRKAFMNKPSHIPYPKGVILYGVQGAGKSLAAKAIASVFNIPLLRCDVGSLYSKYVGDSENRTKQMLRMVDSMSPCVLWIDELEKAMAGLLGQVADSGVTKRVLGQILTWLQEKKTPVYTVGTVNNLTSLPPELVRKGRFDEIFFVDLPNAEERKQIIKIHAGKLQINIPDKSMGLLVDEFRNYTGAEIEATLVEASIKAFNDNKTVTVNDIIAEARRTRTIMNTMGDVIKEIREWGKKHARPASKQDDEVRERNMEYDDNPILG